MKSVTQMFKDYDSREWVELAANDPDYLDSALRYYRASGEGCFLCGRRNIAQRFELPGLPECEDRQRGDVLIGERLACLDCIEGFAHAVMSVPEMSLDITAFVSHRAFASDYCRRLEKKVQSLENKLERTKSALDRARATIERHKELRRQRDERRKEERNAARRKKNPTHADRVLSLVGAGDWPTLRVIFSGDEIAHKIIAIASSPGATNGERTAAIEKLTTRRASWQLQQTTSGETQNTPHGTRSVLSLASSRGG